MTRGIADAYVCRLLPLTCLAADVVEAILDGRQPKGLRLAEMLGSRATAWSEQRTSLGFNSTAAKGPVRPQADHHAGRRDGGAEAEMPWPPACSADDPLTGSLCARCD